MNVDEPFNPPGNSGVQVLGNNEYSAEIAGDSPRFFDMLGGIAEFGLWLSFIGGAGSSGCGGGRCGGG